MSILLANEGREEESNINWKLIDVSDFEDTIFEDADNGFYDAYRNTKQREMAEDAIRSALSTIELNQEHGRIIEEDRLVEIAELLHKIAENIEMEYDANELKELVDELADIVPTEDVIVSESRESHKDSLSNILEESEVVVEESAAAAKAAAMDAEGTEFDAANDNKEEEWGEDEEGKKAA